MSLIPFRRFRQMLSEEGFLRSYVSINGKVFQGDQGTPHEDLMTKAGDVYTKAAASAKGNIQYGFINHHGDYMNQREPSTWEYAKEHNLIDNKEYESWGKPKALLSDILKKKKISDSFLKQRKRLNPWNYLDVR